MYKPRSEVKDEHGITKPGWFPADMGIAIAIVKNGKFGNHTAQILCGPCETETAKKNALKMAGRRFFLSRCFHSFFGYEESVIMEQAYTSDKDVALFVD